MRTTRLAFPLRLATRTFDVHGRPHWRLIGWLIGFGVAQVLLLVGASMIDGTLRLANGVGLLQHYGAWVVLVTDPLLLIATGYANYRFTYALAHLPTCQTTQALNSVEQFLKPHVDRVAARGAYAYGYVACCVAAVLAWANNLYQTSNPVPFYRHDVFDSSAHLFGFLVFKLCVFISWVIVYPIAGYLLITISLSTWMILHGGRLRNLICPAVTHPDNCYGMRNIGRLNISLLIPFALVYSVMASILMTHGRFYRSIDVPLTFVTALFLVESFAVIWPARRLLMDAKHSTLDELATISERFQRNEVKTDEIARFGILRSCFSSAVSSPYSLGGQLGVTAIRAMYVAVLSAKIALQLHG